MGKQQSLTSFFTPKSKSIEVPPTRPNGDLAACEELVPSGSKQAGEVCTELSTQNHSNKHLDARIKTPQEFHASSKTAKPGSRKFRENWKDEFKWLIFDKTTNIAKCQSTGSNSKANDIAVVRLNAPIRLGRKVSPPCMPKCAGRRIQLDKPSTLCFVTGWGETLESGHEDVLKQAPVPLLPLQKCKKWYEGIYNVTDTMLCAGYRGGAIDSCKGDSGGPLVTQFQRRWYLVGVVSFGRDCGLVEQPGMYTKVSAYEKWINDTVDKSMKKTVKRRQRPY